LKRLDSDKEIKVNASAFLWPGLAGFGSIWLDLAKFGVGLEFRWPDGWSRRPVDAIADRVGL
jgi:hypothetical protein